MQGALLGPITLSSIAVFFDLHVKLVAGLPTRTQGAACPGVSPPSGASANTALDSETEMHED